MANRRLTTDRRTKIHELVDLMADFLPLSAHSDRSTTFLKIFSESNVQSYIKQKLPKKKAMTAAWEKIYRRHPKLPFTLIRKIVPAAVDYRRYKRTPLRREEIDRLSDILASLGFDMRRELALVELDETVPEIQVPPLELLKRLEEHPLVTQVAGEPLELFRNGHFNESVRKAAERFEVAVQKKSGQTSSGKDLMGKVFNLDNPVIALNPLKTENDKGIQEGYMHLTIGMIRAIRNIFSHGDEDQRAPEEAYEMLLFINWLFRLLEHAKQTSGE